MLIFLRGSQQIIYKAENSRSSKTKALFRDMKKKKSLQDSAGRVVSDSGEGETDVKGIDNLHNKSGKYILILGSSNIVPMYL